MRVNTFLSHYQIDENPFKSEEARHDGVFSRIESVCHHPEFEKIRGDFSQPSSAIVFGERGSGKTALRLQIEDELRRWNADHPEQRCLLIAYDELNTVLDRFNRRAAKASPLESLRSIRLIDHIDAMMSIALPPILDQVMGDVSSHDAVEGLNNHAARRLRQSDAQPRLDLLLMQVCYDRPESAAGRTARLKRALRIRSSSTIGFDGVVAGTSLVLALAAAGYFLLFAGDRHAWLWYVTIALLLMLAAIAAARAIFRSWQTHRFASTLASQLRVMDRSVPSYRESLRSVHASSLATAGLPLNDDDDARYAMLRRLISALRPFGYVSIIVLVDRVDEPTLIHGEPERMKAFVWPMLDNKFLQQDRVGLKLLLPLELRYLLERESAQFYRSARLDKQNLIDNLTWSGATLYDLCTARLQACRSPGAEPISLRDLFDDSISAQDLIDALDQMHQPRDAFKFLYRLIQEHCANVPEEKPQFKIPRPLLDATRKQQVERLSGMLRGVRPA